MSDVMTSQVLPGLFQLMIVLGKKAGILVGWSLGGLDYTVLGVFLAWFRMFSCGLEHLVLRY